VARSGGVWVAAGVAPRLVRLAFDGRRRRLQLLELFLDRRQVRVQSFFQQVGLRRIELLAAAVEPQPLVARQLLGELINARALEEHLALKRFDLAEQIPGHFAQLRRRQRL